MNLFADWYAGGMPGKRRMRKSFYANRIKNIGALGVRLARMISAQGVAGMRHFLVTAAVSMARCKSPREISL
jgi:hypothetical protein